MSITIETGIATQTTTGVERGIDVCFDLEIDGSTIAGECTLLPHEDGRPGYGAWGDVDMWLDGATVALLRGRADRREILDIIESECGPVAEAL